MREKLFTSAGFYYSSYFRIKVETNDTFLSFDENTSELGAAIFFHEYIHFLQDITTTNGLFNIITEVDFIKLFNSKLQSSTEAYIEVPFKTALEDGNVYISQEMKKVWIGGGEHRDFDGEYSLSSETYNLAANDMVYPLNRQFIEVGNKNEGGFKYYFGSYCICEGMAYEMEQIVYPSIILPLPTKLPYSAPRLVANKLYPGFSDDAENIIALCDASLMYNDPGSVYCQILKLMHQKVFSPEKAEDIYDFVYSNISFNYEQITEPQELFHYAGHLCTDQVSDYFRSNIFGANDIWISRTLSAAQTLRTQIPSFMLDLVRAGDIRESDIFAQIKAKIGTPIIVNNQNEMFFENILNAYGYPVKPEYFWVFSEIRDLITKDWNKLGRSNLCGLKEFCDAGNPANPFTDYRCRSEPWARANDPNPDLCIFGATWKSWALEGRNIKQENN